MTRIAILSAALATLVALPPATRAQAQANTTFLSGTPGNSTTCTRSAPCNDMGLAIAATADNGTIACLDSGRYGGAPVTKSLTIDCTGTSSSLDISVNTPGLRVTVRGVRFDFGFKIQFQDGASLVVENCLFAGGQSAVSGISFQPQSANAQLVVTNSVFDNLGLANIPTGSGILVRPQAGGSAVVSLDNVTVANNVFGIVADGSSSTAGIAMVVANSDVHRNVQDGIVATTPSGGAPIGLTVKNTRSLSNTNGIRATGSGVTVRADNTTVMHNATGLVVTNGAALLSVGNNLVVANGVNGAFSGSVALQ